MPALPTKPDPTPLRSTRAVFPGGASNTALGLLTSIADLQPRAVRAQRAEILLNHHSHTIQWPPPSHVFQKTRQTQGKAIRPRPPSICCMAEQKLGSVKGANFDFQATIVSVAGANAAVMDDTLRDRQAQTGAVGLVVAKLRHAVERFEEARESDKSAC